MVASNPSSSTGIPKAIWRLIWGTNVPQKIKIFVWKVCNNIFPVKGNLMRGKLSREGVCPICGESEETVEHVSLFCSWTNPVWFGSQLQSIPDMGAIPSLHDWFSQISIKFQEHKDYRDYIFTVVFCLLRSIWKARNKCVFENIIPNSVSTIIEANSLIIELESIKQQNTPTLQVPSGPIPWRPPPTGYMKLNVDASYNKEAKIGYAGILGRNEDGLVVLGLTKKFPVSSPLLAEALAMREAVQVAANFGLPKIILESDCLSLIQVCMEQSQIGEINAVVTDIIQLKRGFQQCGITWVYRSGNKSTHTLAKLTKQDLVQGNWMSYMPSQLKMIVEKERLKILRSNLQG